MLEPIGSSLLWRRWEKYSDQKCTRISNISASFWCISELLPTIKHLSVNDDNDRHFKMLPVQSPSHPQFTLPTGVWLCWCAAFSECTMTGKVRIRQTLANRIVSAEADVPDQIRFSIKKTQNLKTWAGEKYLQSELSRESRRLITTSNKHNCEADLPVTG